MRLESEKTRVEHPAATIEQQRASVAPVAWGFLALACIGVLMYAGFVTRGSDEIAGLAFGKWPYLIYVLLLVCFLNIGLDLWLKATWVIEYARTQAAKATALKKEASELSARIPGSDPAKVEKMLRERGRLERPE